MPAGDAALAQFIAGVRKLRTLPEDAAKIAAPIVERIARESAAAGVAPDGTPWPAKKGGGRALAGAAAALTARAVGRTVVLILKGPYVLHSIGKGHAPRRQILPDTGTGELPPNMAAALREAATTVFRRAMGGG
jgi:hypothetical protein